MVTGDPVHDPHSALTAWVDAARAGGFPMPQRADRWTPLRAGVVNLWEFEATEYWYANGWVQLTGRNETGKSSLMALTTLIPWLADTSSSNIDTLGRSGKKFRYYVEPTGADGDRRTSDGSTSRGWLWVEYGRLTAAGPRFFTVLQFAEARSASATLNLTWCTLEGRDRVRQTIQLAPGRTVAAPKEVPALEVHPDATRYRAHVAQRLLGSSAERLEAVGKMLRETRTPKLGANLQVGFVQEYLRNALPALSRSEVDALAAGWDQLDQIRADLQASKEAADTLGRFIRMAWLPWVRAVLRASADEAASARSRLDSVTRAERAAQTELERCQSECESLATQAEQAHREAAAARVAADELQQSARYLDAQARIAHLGSKRLELARLTAECSGKEADVAGAESRAAGEAEDLAAKTAELSAQEKHCEESAATFATTVVDHLGPISRPIDVAWGAQALIDRMGRVAAAQRLRKVADERELKARDSEERAEQARDAADTARASAEEAWKRAQTERGAIATALTAWAVGAHPPIEAETVETWCAGLAATVGDDGVVPGQRVVDEVRTAWFELAHTSLLSAQERARHREQTTQAELTDLQSQIAELLATRTPVFPPPQQWQRRARPEAAEVGAPLWSLLDPRPDADATYLAAVEAALAASGLLDAWVTPDGLYDPGRDGDDSVIMMPTPVPHASLHELLLVADSAGPLTQTVSALLSGISYSADDLVAGSPGPMALSGAGEWVLGTLAGRAQPRHGRAEWIGEAARAQQRQRRLAELTTAREQVESRLRGLAEELSALAAALDHLSAALAACPRDDELRDLLNRAGQRDDAAEHAAAVAVRATEQANKHREQAAGALAEVLHSCSHASLPNTADGLSTAADQVRAGQSALREYQHAGEKLELIARALNEARERAAATADELTRRRDALRRAADELHAIRVTVQTLEAAAGADDQQILAELDVHRGAEAAAEQLRGELADSLRQVDGARGAAQATLERTQVDRETAQSGRDRAYADFRMLVDRGLADELGLTLPNPSAVGVEAIRDQVAETRRAVEPRNWPSNEPAEQRKTINNLAAELHTKAGDARSELERAGRTLRVITEDGLDRIEVTVDATGTPFAPKQAIDQVRQIHDELDRNYNDQVQQTLDELLGSTFLEHLRDRLGATDRLIDQINGVLAEHPVVTTRTSLRIRLIPAAEAERTLIEAVRGPQLANPEVAARVRDHLRDRVERAKTSAAREGDANWHDRLAQELDYRRWFEVTLHKKVGQDGHWTPLTQRSFAEMSGGARAVMLMLPLVATLAAYYSEMPEAPRPLWLDEAFEGLDSANRATVMDLFHSFDLDVLLAGPARLVNVASVPAAAIYQVVRAPAPTPGVDLALELWAGGELRAIELPITLPSGSPAHTDPVAEAPEGTLL